MKDNYNFGNLDGSQVTPSLGVPLINSKIGIDKLILDPNDSSGLFSLDEDSLIHILYNQKLTTITAEEFEVSIDDQVINQSPSLEPISVSSIQSLSTIPLSAVTSAMNEPEKSTIENADGGQAIFPAFSVAMNQNGSLDTLEGFDFIYCSSGSMNLTVTNNWPFDLENFSINILNGDDNSVLASFSFPLLSSGSSESMTVDISNSRMDNQLNVQFGNVESPGTDRPKSVNLNSLLHLNFTTSEMVVTSGSLVIPSIEVTNDTIENEILFQNDEVLKEFTLSNGTLGYDILYELDEYCEIVIYIPQARSTSGALYVTIPLEPSNGPNFTGEIDLSGYKFTFSDDLENTIVANVIVNIISSEQNRSFDVTDRIDANISLSGFEVEFVRGFLGYQLIEVDGTTIDFSLGTEDIPGNFELADPKMGLTFVSSFGLPLDVYLNNIKFGKEGLEYDFTGEIATNPSLITPPSLDAIGDSVITKIEISRENSNIENMFNLPPDKVIPNVYVRTNPNGFTDSNFFDTQSKMNVYLDVDIPLNARLSEFYLKDTLGFSFGNLAIDLERPSYITATFENEFPIDVSVQAYFVDDNFNILDSLTSENRTILAANIDSLGNYISPGESSLLESLEGSRMENLANASQIILDIKVNTPENGTQSGKFYANKGLKFKLGLVATLKFF